MDQPNEEQLAAIKAYAAHHGRYWKAQLSTDWMNGRDAGRHNGHLLRQVRNQFGPAWLAKFTLEK